MAAHKQPLRELVIVVDTLEESCAASLQHDALARFSQLAALSAIPLQPFHVGLCTISKLENGRDVHLKVHLAIDLVHGIPGSGPGGGPPHMHACGRLCVS